MKAAFFDVDGTLTKARIWEGILAYFDTFGGKRATKIIFFLYHMPLVLLYRAGLLRQIRMRRPWGRNLAWFFRGMSVEEVDRMAAWVVDEFFVKHWHEDSLRLVDQHLRNGDEVVLVSTSPAPLLRRIAAQLGVKHVVGTEPRVRNGRYTGGITGQVCIGEYKAILAREYLENKGLHPDLEASSAYADSPGDLSLLEMVGHPTATHPDEVLRPIAEARGWPIFPEED